MSFHCSRPGGNMKKITKEDWCLMMMALYRAARWEESLADSLNVDEAYAKERQDSLALVKKFEELRNRFYSERRGK